MRTLLLLVALGFEFSAAGCITDSLLQPRLPARATRNGNPNERRQQALEVIRKLKGEVQIDPGDADKSVVRIDLHGIASAAPLLNALGPLPKLRELNLFNTEFTDADMEQLRGLVNLQTLNLSATRITDKGLALLELPSLRKLYLNDTRVTDTGLGYVRNLKNLTDVALFRTPVTDEGVVQLAALPHLQKLTLGGRTITDRSLLTIRRMSELRELYVYTTRVTPGGVEDLKLASPQLKIFH